MDFEQWLTAIGLPAEAQVVATQTVDVAPWQRRLGDPVALKVALFDQPQLALAIMAQLFFQDRAHYPDEAAWLLNSRDLTLWVADYAAHNNGAVGVTENDWLAMTLSHRVVRLGRLQFEPVTLSAAMGPLAVGTKALYVHVPADGPLEPVACDAAFAAAKQRFGELPLLCESWLLSPALQQLLPSSSNILQFAARFVLFDQLPQSHQGEERIFGEWLTDANAYPATTSLQRQAKAWLLQGQVIGEGIGLALPSNW